MPSQPCDTSWQLVFAVTPPLSSPTTLQCSMGKSYSLLCPGAFPTFLVPGMVRPGQRPPTTRCSPPRPAPLVVNGNLRTSRRVLLRILEQDSDVSSDYDDDESEPPGGSIEDAVLDDVRIIDPIEPGNEFLRVKVAPPECNRVSAQSPDGETEIVDPAQIKVNTGESKYEWRKVTFALMNRARFEIPPDAEYSCQRDVDYDVDKTDLLGSTAPTDLSDGGVVEEGVVPVRNGVVKVTREGDKESEKVSFTES